MAYNPETDKPQRVQKEEVAGLHFPLEDVLVSADDIKIRNAGLDRALKLGNLEHAKIKIVFEDVIGLKEVETTVWGVTDKRVILKQGLVIPIHRIYEIV